MMRWFMPALGLVVSVMPVIPAFSATPVSGKEYSQYVSLQPKSCKLPDASTLAWYHARDLAVSECPSKVTWQGAPVRLLVASSGERSWLDISVGNTIWSGEEEMVYEQENQFGHFPNIGHSPAEIRIGPAGITGVVVRVLAQDPESLSVSGASGLSRLFVFGFMESGVCFMGLVRDNISARNLPDSGQNCKRMLKTYRIPALPD